MCASAHLVHAQCLLTICVVHILHVACRVGGSNGKTNCNTSSSWLGTHIVDSYPQHVHSLNSVVTTCLSVAHASVARQTTSSSALVLHGRSSRYLAVTKHLAHIAFGMFASRLDSKVA